MKPAGVRLVLSGGSVHFAVTPVDRVADRVWAAVRDAITANMSPEQFKAEAAEAWAHYLKEDATYAEGVLRK